jgi:heme/copper-type cytochrome/quinol oxidase subunit 3
LIVACIFTPWGLPLGAIPVTLALGGWFWPKPPHKTLLAASPAGAERPGDSAAEDLEWGSREPMFWGVLLMIVIELSAFAMLLGSYFYLRGNEPTWPPPGVLRAELWPAAAGAVVLVATIVTQHGVNGAAVRGDVVGMRRWLVATTVLVAVFVGLRFLEFRYLPFFWDSHAYGSAFWVLLGYHALHAVSGLIENLLLIALLYRGPVERKHSLDIQLSGLYWSYVVAEGLVAFAILYLERYR